MAKPFRHPEKWRETVDPFSLPFHAFRPVEILGYPHAGNDVFHVRGIYNGQETTAYLKVARRKDAAIENEVAILCQLALPTVPPVLDAGFGPFPFSVTGELPGLRLSVLVGGNDGLVSLEYMEEYGEALGRIHGFKISAAPVADRQFFHVPPEEVLEMLQLSFLKDYFAHAPTDITTVFCHGDFHYANLLWNNHHISAILDFELSGYGNRDFDIAWALIRRPGQRFLKTEQEQARFLTGYAKHRPYNLFNIHYYMAQIYVYFMRSAGDDPEYCDYVRRWLSAHCGSK